MALLGEYFWKKTPFIRLLLALIAGIIVQWNFSPPIIFPLILSGISLAIIILVFFLPVIIRYRATTIIGIFISLLFLGVGAIITWKKDIRNERSWLGNFYSNQDGVIVSLREVPVEKTKSFKANASVHYLVKNNELVPVKGKIILYFKKEAALLLGYGSQIILKKSLQEIKNSGNPGGFDYKRYSLFQGITHQVYLKSGEYEILRKKRGNIFQQFIIDTREKVLQILRRNIKGEKELGLAEALLIGYKNDLEQSLVQSYTNTGVVHIIAISGLHLGLIYWLLAILFKPLQKNKKLKWLRPLLIITGLWLFSLLAGAQPSILRSALMFSCIVLGESLSRKTSIYNTMALSAFILLLLNPFWLWDVGFQLSYAAVLSIIIFMRPVYNLLYIKNKLLDFLWKLNAVTIAAQVLTVPLSIYHFHQFPNLFLLTNFLAVPLSSVILLGEIFLCVIFFIPFLAKLTGQLLSWLIQAMNTYIERIEAIRFSLWDGLQISIVQSILLLVVAAGLSYWLMQKSKRGLLTGLSALLLFVILRSISFLESNSQQKIVVYNVPQKSAIDFINGRNYFFAGDSSLLADDFARNFHLKPSRILYRIKNAVSLPGLAMDHNYASFLGKNILMADRSISFSQLNEKPAIDLLIISKNPKLYFKNIAGMLNIKQVVFDGSVPAWKTRYWKKDCDSLQIPWHDVTTQGAFEMKLN
jgi:competence protein ComEC